MGIWYATRGDVKSALDSKESARNNVQVDRAIESASRAIESLTHRTFAPVLATRYFDYPNDQRARSGRLWLAPDDLISVTTFSSGGDLLTPSEYFLEPVNSGPPYDRVEINLAGNGSLSAGSTYQHAIAITGLWGWWSADAAYGTVAEPLDGTETGVDVSDSSQLDVGAIIRVDSERMIVTGRTMLTTAQTLQTPVQALDSDTTIAVTTGSSYNVGEVILLDSERMLVVDIAGNSLTVVRAWDGSVLATHTGSTIYAPRTLTVERGALGTTAASHLTAAPLYKFTVPGGVKELCIAEAATTLIRESGGYARFISQGESKKEYTVSALQDLRDQVYRTYGRRARTAAI